MATIYLFENFNNYYNREIKYFGSINEYIGAVDTYYTATNQQFKLADGVNTTYTWNLSADDDCEFVDYLIAVDDLGAIQTRWFVIEQHKTRASQYQLILRRDLIADFLESFKQSTIYLEKGWINDTTNPLIYNQEQFTANQIKQKEVELKDKLGLKWIVGYLNKESFKPEPSASSVTSITTFTNEALNYDTSVSSIDAWRFNDFISDYKSYLKDFSVVIDTLDSQSIDQTCYRNTIKHKSVSSIRIAPAERNGFITKAGGEFYNPFDVLDSSAYNWNTIKQRLVTEGQTTFGVTDSLWNEVFAEKGKIIFDQSANKYYKVHLKQINAFNNTKQIVPSIDVDIYTTCSNYVTNQGGYIQQQSNQNFKIIREWSVGVKVELEEVYNEGYQVAIDYDKHIRAVNEAYDVFAIPVLDQEASFDIVKDIITGFETWNSFNSQNYNSAFAIGQALTAVSSQALDLQLLPYCPLPREFYDIVDGKPTFYLKTSQNAETWQIINRAGSDAAQNVIFWLNNTEFSNTITYVDDNDYSTPENIKVINQLNTYRLCAGDYSSSFEFNAARNDGIPFFEIDVKLKPYAPYIHVAPFFGGLYGQDFNDTRGLVCSNTNFSLSRGTNAWETYERNNLNYQNAFNRQIENMEVQRKYQRVQEFAGTIAGAGQGAVGGGALGYLAGSTPIGAAIGAGASAATGIADMYINEQLYKENKQYAIDQFDMSLENIRALPNTLVATGAQNPNNKVFPVLEIYSCSEIEKEAYLSKLKWNGMTIGIITESIGTYLKPNDRTYIKGQLIYIDDTFNPYKASEIANELSKGLLIQGGII